MTQHTHSPWWTSAVFYQIYPRSFADANGDGVGDLAGIISRLDYLKLLGVDALWLSPIMKSPMVDHGYDVSDPRDIDPLFGSTHDCEELIAQAHKRNIKVIMDLVPNHTSDQHEWFQEALASPPGSPERQRYHFKDGLGDNGDIPPNNWPSIFGGSAWERVYDIHGNPEQWYLHIFAPEQPDLNWDNPQVWQDLEHTLTFWLDKGIDGFRIDVAHGMAKPDGLPDMDLSTTSFLTEQQFSNDLRFDHPKVHDIHKKIRQVLNRYPQAMTVGEIWVKDSDSFAKYIRPDELHLGFNFFLTTAQYNAKEIKKAIEDSLVAVTQVNGTPTWALSNHDVSREVSRYSICETEEIGRERAQAMFLVVMALPGTVFIYQGSELGLPDAHIPPEERKDPMWIRSNQQYIGRDGVRVPLPWEGQTSPFGFTTTTPWLPIPPEWEALTVEKQINDPHSTFTLYQAAIHARSIYHNQATTHIHWHDAPGDCLIFHTENSNILCILNASTNPIPLPAGEIILASSPLSEKLLPPNSAAWIYRAT